MNSVPDRVLGIVELDSYPAPRFKDTETFPEATLHEVLVLHQSLSLYAIYDGFWLVIGENPGPGLAKEIQLGVHQVTAERRIGEDIVYTVVRKR